MNQQMKESSISWFGEIPSHWEIVQVKRIFVIGRGRVIATTELKDNGYPVYSSQTKNKGLLGYIDSYDFDRSQLTWTTDGANAGTVFLREGKHNCTNVCGTLMPKTNDNSLRYLKYALEYTAIYHKRADINGYKIMNNEMADIHILLPPINEQERIANYLDQQCLYIDSVLEQICSSIEEYKKLKQSIITQAVTKGVRGDRPMKDSGIEWIQEIPAEVKISRVGLHFDIILGKMICSELKSPDMREYPYYCAANVHFDGVDSSDLKKMWFTEAEIEQYQVKAGDLLVVEGGAGAGGCAIADTQCEKIGIQNSIQIVRAKTEQDIRFLCYYLQSIVKRKYIDVVCNKATIPHFTKDKLANVPYPLWTVKEQSEIADYLDKKCAAIDNLIAQKEKFLLELEDYKKSMIYEYVTGKKEVPHN